MSNRISHFPQNRAARRRRSSGAAVAGGDDAASASDRGADAAGAHGGALHAERREHERLGAGRYGPRLQALAHAAAAERFQRRDHRWSRISGTPASKDGDGHYVKEAAILTSTRISKTLGEDLNSHGVSMDQVAAQKVGGQTPLPSLELGISPEATGVDLAVGYTRVYGCHIAWSSPTTPLAREINPRSVYERLFRASGPQRQFGRSRTRCCWIACWVKRRNCARSWEWRTGGASMSTCRSCARSKSARERATVNGRGSVEAAGSADFGGVLRKRTEGLRRACPADAGYDRRWLSRATPRGSARSCSATR